MNIKKIFILLIIMFCNYLISAFAAGFYGISATIAFNGYTQFPVFLGLIYGGIIFLITAFIVYKIASTQKTKFISPSNAKIYVLLNVLLCTLPLSGIIIQSVTTGLTFN